MSEVEPALVLDVLGRKCPMPIIELAAHIEDVAVGEVVEVVSDDTAARIDVPVWCRMKRHEYVGAEPREHGVGYLVRRSS